VFCTKIDNVGIYDAKKGIYRSRQNNFKLKGVSDIIGIFNGKFLAIEVKSAKGKLSEHQIEFLLNVESHGGIAIIARSVEDVEQALFGPGEE
jgi:penicillin-binding protein-related factor A (putative recombinase)